MNKVLRPGRGSGMDSWLMGVRLGSGQWDDGRERLGSGQWDDGRER